MGFSDLLISNVSIRRKSDLLRTQAPIGETMALSTQPSTAGKLLLRVSGGTTGSGTLTIAGITGGISGLEVVTFTANGAKETTKLFSEVTNITQSGFTNEASIATLEVRARTAAGQPLYGESLIFERKARIVDLGTPRYAFLKQGAFSEATHKIFLLYDASQEILEKDILVDDSTGKKYEVLPSTVVEDSVGPHHVELMVKRVTI